MMTDLSRRPAVLLLLTLIFTGTVFSQDIADTRVKYLSGSTVYLAGGANIGLHTGDRLDVFRNSRRIARIEVAYLATASASCKIISQEEEILVGDLVRWVKRTEEQTEPDTTAARRMRVVPDRPESTELPAFRTYISGGLSVQWYHRSDRSPAGLNFDQWSARLTLRVRNLWTRDLNLNVNTRARFDRRTTALRSDVPEDEWRNRIYWISIAYEPADAPVHFQVGRIASNKFSGIGYIDGLILQHNWNKSFNWGIFGGVQPDMQAVNFSADMQKYGLFGTYRHGTYSDTYLQATVALAGSYTSGEVNREYAYIEFRISGQSGWRFSHNMEVDYNRSWRKTYSGTSVSLTSLYFSGSYEFNESVTAGLGYDNRKNYLTYVYYSKAQELFDEQQRQSLRADLRVRVPADIMVTVRGGLREGENDAEMSYNYGVSLIKSNLIRKYLQATLSFTGFHNLYNQGISPTASVRYQMGSSSAAAAYGAYRYTMSRVDEERMNQYLNLTFSVPFRSSIYLVGHYYYDWGDDMQGHRVLTELGYRF